MLLRHELEDVARAWRAAGSGRVVFGHYLGVSNGFQQFLEQGIAFGVRGISDLFCSDFFNSVP